MAEPEQNRDIGQPHGGPAQAVVDETIANIENLYRTVTGRTPPAADRPYAPIPAEKDPGQHVEEQLNRLTRLLGGAGFDGHATSAWTPRMSVWESEEEILVCLDVPGVTRDDLKVTARGNLITVTGLRRAPRDGDDHRLFVTEEPAGEFRRTLLVPGGLAAGEPRAELKEGVLEITIRREGGQGRGTRSVQVN
jgi:HSP20 family protein